MRQSGLFPPCLLEALETADIDRSQSKLLMLRVSELSARMVANQDICTNTGVLLLRKGEDLTISSAAAINSLRF